MNQPVLQEPGLLEVESKKLDSTWKRFQSVLSPHTPVLVLDEEGSVRHITASARRLLDYRNDQAVDPCFFTHVHSRNQYQVMRDVADMVCYGKAQASWLLRLRTGQGRWHWFKATAKNQLGGPAAAIVITLSDLHGL